jgi:hypothetical protein
MPKVWDILDEKSKENLIKKARELGMFDFDPEGGHKEPEVKVQGNLESVEEIDHLMRVKPGFLQMGEKK